MASKSGVFVGIDKDQIKDLIGSLERLERVLQDGSKATDNSRKIIEGFGKTLSSAFQGIDVTKVIRALDSFFKTAQKFSGLDFSGLVNLENVLKRLGDARLAGNLDSFKALDKLFKTLEKGRGAANAISLLFTSLSSLRTLNTGQIDLITAALQKLATEAATFDIGNIQKLSTLLKALKSVATFDASKFANLSKAFDQIQAFFTKASGIKAAGLNSLSRIFATFGQLIDIIDKLNFDAFGDFSLKAIGITGFIGTLTLVASITSRFAPKPEKLRALAKFISELAQVFVLLFQTFGRLNFEELALTLSKLVIVMPLLGVIFAGFNKLAFGGSSRDRIISFAEFLEGIGIVFHAINSIGEINIVEVLKRLAQFAFVFTVLERLVKQFIKGIIAIPGNSAEMIKAIAEFLGGFGRMFDSLERLKAINILSVIALVVKMTLLFPVLKTNINAFFKLGAINTENPERIVRAFAEFFSSLPRLFDFIESLRKRALGDLISALVKTSLFFPVMGLVIRNFLKLATEDVSGADKLITSFAEFFRSLPRLFAALDAISKFSFGQIINSLIKTALVLNVLGNTLRGVAKATGAQADPKGFRSFVAGFLDFTQSLRSLVTVLRYIDSLNIVTLIKITIKFGLFMNTIKGSFIDIIKTVSKIPEGNLRAGLDFIQSMAVFIREFTQLFGELDKFKVNKNTETIIKAIRNTLNEFTRLNFKRLPSKESISVLDSISDIIRKFASVFRDIKDIDIGKFEKESKTFSRTLRDTVEQLAKATNVRVDKNRLNSVKDLIQGVVALSREGANISSFGKFGDALQKLFKSLNEIRLDNRNLKNINKDLKGLVNALKPLEKIDVNTAKIEAIANILSSIRIGVDGSKLKNFDITPTVDKQKAAQDARETGAIVHRNFSDEVTSGVLRANIITGAFNAIREGFASVFSHINPAPIIDFITNIRRRFAQFFTEIGSQARNIGQELIDVGQQILDNFGLQRIFQSSAFSAAIEFEDALNQLRVFGNLTEEQTEVAEAFANQIGIQYPLSSAEAVVALTNLQRAGLDLNEAMLALPAAADLAAISDNLNIDATSASLIALTQGFAFFTDEVEGTFENAAVASDILARAANASTASVDSLVAGFENAIPAANAFGLTMEDTAAVIAIFQNAGVEGAEAGTLLGSTINSITRPQSITALRQLGVEVFDAQGNVRDLNDIITDLSGALEGMTEAERSAALSQIADTFGRRGLQILLEAGVDGIDNFVAGMNELPGAGEQARELLNSMSGDLLQLRGSFETLLNRALLPLIQNGVRPLVQGLRFLVDSFNLLPQPIINVITNAVILGSAFATLVGVVTLVVGGLSILGGTVLTVVGSLILFLTNITAIVGGIVTFVAALGSLAIIFGVILPLVTGISAAFTYLVDLFANDVGGAATAFNNLSAALGSVLSTIGTLVSTVIGIGGSLFGDTFSQSNVRVGRAIANVFGRIQRSLSSLTAPLIQVREVIQTFQAFLNARQAFNLDDIFGFDELGNNFSQIETGFLGTYNRLLQRLSNNRLVQNIFGQDVTEEALHEFFQSIVDTVDRIKEDVGDIFGGLGNIISGNFLFGANRIETGVSDILELVATAIQNVTGIDLASSILSFQERDILQGVGELVDSLLDSFFTLLNDNRDAIADTLASLLVTIVPTGRLSFAARLFGLENLASALDAAGTIITEGFNRIIQTVFGLLAGESLIDALLGAGFTTGEATAISNAFSEIGRSVDLVIGIFGALFNALFPAGNTEGGSFIESAFTGIATAFGTFNTLVLVPLQTALPGIVTIAQTVFSTIQTIIQTFIDYLTTAGAPITDLLSSLFSGEIDFGAFLQGLPQAILSTLGNLITGLPDLIGDTLSTIGESIGSTLLAEIGNAISAGDPSALATTLADALRTLVTTALGSLPEIITEIGTILDLSSVISFGENLESNETFQDIVSGLSDLVALPLETLSAVFEGVGAFFTALNGTDPQAAANARSVLLVIGSIATAAGIAALPAILPIVATALGAIGAAAVPLALAATAITLIKNAFENLGELLETGDFGAFLVDTLTGMASDILGFFGQEITAEEISSTITGLFSTAALIIEFEVTRIINGILSSIRSLVAQVGAAVDDAENRLRLQLNPSDTQAQEFFTVQSALAQQTGVDFFNTIGDALVGAVDPNELTNQLVAQFSTVLQNFNAILPSLAAGELTPEQFSNVLTTLISSGQFTQALNDAAAALPPDALAGFLNQLLTVDPAVLASLDLSALGTQLVGLVSSGELTAEAANAFISNLVSGGIITPEAGAALQANIEASIVPAATAAGENAGAAVQEGIQTGVAQGTIGGAPVQADVQVEVNPLISPEEQALFGQSVSDQASATTIPPAEVDAPIGLGIDEESNLEDVQALNDEVSLLSTNVVNLQTTIATFVVAPEVIQFGTLLFDISVDFDRIKNAIQRVVGKIGELTLVFATASETLPTYTVAILESISAFQDNAILSLDLVKGAATALLEQLVLVSNYLTEIGSIDFAALGGVVPGTSAGTGGTNSGAGSIGGRARGGAVTPRSIFEIVEEGVPEVLRSGGKTYLLTAGGGFITPLKNLPVSSSATRTGSFGSLGATRPPSLTANTSNNQNVNITEGAISITIPPNAGLQDQAALVAAIQESVRLELAARDRSILERLRSAGRS